jgi:hypothetical protein
MAGSRDRKDELLTAIGNFRREDAVRDHARAELDSILVTDVTQALAELVSELKGHREAITEAATSADRTARRLVAATWALGVATLGLVLATGALVAAAIYGGH